MATLTQRMQGAARLDVSTYEEVEHDLTATGQAATVVAIAAIAQGIGHLGRGGPGLVAGVLLQLVMWAVWAGVTYQVGTRLFGGTATWGELLRTLGFAQAPGVFFALGFVPLLGWAVRLAVTIWLAVTGYVAIRQALDVSDGKALATAGISWIAVIVLGMMLSLVGLGWVVR